MTAKTAAVAPAARRVPAAKKAALKLVKALKFPDLTPVDYKAIAKDTATEKVQPCECQGCGSLIFKKGAKFCDDICKGVYEIEAGALVRQAALAEQAAARAAKRALKQADAEDGLVESDDETAEEL